MMQVVLDTNIIVSAYLNEDGPRFKRLGIENIFALPHSEP